MFDKLQGMMDASRKVELRGQMGLERDADVDRAVR